MVATRIIVVSMWSLRGLLAVIAHGKELTSGLLGLQLELNSHCLFNCWLQIYEIQNCQTFLYIGAYLVFKMVEEGRFSLRAVLA